MEDDMKNSENNHNPTKGLYGSITHTELASKDPNATKVWCDKVLGWNFMMEFPTPAGQYHLFSYSDQGGGGIRSVGEGESPGVVPFVHVSNTDEAFKKALDEGAEELLYPDTKMPGVRIAIVKAPGGVVIGFSGPSEPIE